MGVRAKPTTQGEIVPEEDGGRVTALAAVEDGHARVDQVLFHGQAMDVWVVVVAVVAGGVRRCR